MMQSSANISTASPAPSFGGNHNHGMGCEGKIIIVRYDHSHIGPWLTTTHMAFTVALANAMQEPGSARYDWRPYTNRVSHSISREENDRPPRLENLLHAAMMMGGLEGEPLSCAPLVIPAPCRNGVPNHSGKVPNFRLFDGRMQEKQEFILQAPPFFFVNCQLQRTDVEGDFRVVQPLVAPVFKKRGDYYICGGQSNSKVYRIGDIGKLFFTAEGHDMLEAVLSLPFSEHIDNPGWDVRVKLPRTDDCATHEVLCVPKRFHDYASFHSDLWDQYSRSEIRDMCSPYKVVDSSRVPGDEQYCLQVIDLFDTNNIKDLYKKCDFDDE